MNHLIGTEAATTHRSSVNGFLHHPINDVRHPVESSRVRNAHRAYTTRRIPDEWLAGLSLSRSPRPGDLVLARVEKLGQHKTLHLPCGRKRILFEEDEIVVAFGHRYAPDQFEAEIPISLGSCHLVASGGVASRVLSKHRRMAAPTLLKTLGLVSREPGGDPLNLADAALPCRKLEVSPSMKVIAVPGTSMNAGKTTAAASLIRGLKRAGFAVGYAKVTGTGSGGDPWLLSDAGASVVLDFTDAGYVSTYKLPLVEAEQIVHTLLGHLASMQIDVAVVELADGIYQRETAHLLRSDTVRSLFHGILFAAGDASGAVAGGDWLLREGHKLLGITGSLTSSPLQAKEAQAETGMPIIHTHGLAEPRQAKALLERCMQEN